jgi:hypothetical protein
MIITENQGLIIQDEYACWRSFMGYTLTEKILRQHLADGFYEPGKKSGNRIVGALIQASIK